MGSGFILRVVEEEDTALTGVPRTATEIPGGIQFLDCGPGQTWFYRPQEPGHTKARNSQGARARRKRNDQREVLMTREEALDLAIKMEADLKDRVVYGQKLVIKRDEDRNMMVDGLYAPEEVNTKRTALSGRVIMVGLGLSPSDPTDIVAGLQVGDKVYFTRYNLTEYEITIGDETHTLHTLHAGDIHIGERG